MKRNWCQHDARRVKANSFENLHTLQGFQTRGGVLLESVQTQEDGNVPSLYAGSKDCQESEKEAKGGPTVMISTLRRTVGKKKQKVSFRHVFESFVKPACMDAKCTTKHIQETERHLARWESFWSANPTDLKNPKLPGCTREHMETWRRHLIALDQLSTRSINKHLGTIRSIMVAADKHGLLKRRPKLEQLPDVAADTARKIYLRDEQLDALMAKTDGLAWPPKSITGVEPSTWWKCAIVMYRTYGFRTQELLAYESHKQPITVANISLAEESPNPLSDLRNAFGWLYYTPPKTQRKKPTPIYLPLTKYTRAAIDALSAANRGPACELFPMPRSQSCFLNEWYRWFELAGVKPKIAGAKFRPYHMRKTCATHLSQHSRGLATAVCRWGSEGSEAKVAMDHYISDDMLLMELLTAPMPKSFDTLLTVVDE